MEKNMKHIDNLFKEELGSYTELPPSAVWDSLEKRLSESRRRRVFPFRWLWYISIVAFVVLIGSAAVWKLQRDGHDDTRIASATESTMPKPQGTVTPATETNNHTAENTSANNRKHS